jgi:hypothetical protein
MKHLIPENHVRLETVSDDVFKCRFIDDHVVLKHLV